MDEAVLETFTNVKFIEGQTRLNQSNWQDYFTNIIPSGVYKGLLVTNYLDGIWTNEVRYLTDGIVFANGVCAKIETENGFTDIGGYLPQDSTIRDRLTCVRVYFDQEKAEIVQKTNIADADSHVYNVLDELLSNGDESTYCTRNEYYWDIPIFYQAKQMSSIDVSWQAGRSLRHVIDFTNEVRNDPEDITGVQRVYSKVLISGKNRYSAAPLSGTSYVDIVMDNLKYNLPNGALLYVYGDSDAPISVRFRTEGWLNSFISGYQLAGGANYRMVYITDDTSGWTTSLSGYKTYTVPQNTAVCFRITYLWGTHSYPYAGYRIYIEVLNMEELSS